MSVTFLPQLELEWKSHYMACRRLWQGIPYPTPNLDRKIPRLRVGRNIYPRGKAIIRLITLERAASNRRREAQGLSPYYIIG
ncbi:hypothetical protein GTB64_004424 [Salmonella enterica]|nr:hypothetical protein [Salmonella enterica]